MYRLPRQIVQLRTVTRVARVQRPTAPPRTSFFFSRRHYVSQNRPRTPAQKFDRILETLRPDMRTNELAKKLAALLVLSEPSKELTVRMFEAVQPLVDARDPDDQSMLSEKVDLYLADRPKDDYDSYVDSLDTLSRRENRYAELPSDPSIEHPLDTLMAHLSAEDMKNKLKELNPLHQQEIFRLWHTLTENQDNMEGFVEMAELLEDHDMPITYKRRVTEDETPLPEWVGEARELIRENDELNAKIGLGPETDMGLGGAFQGSREDALFDQPQETDEEQPTDEAVPEEETETKTSTFQYPNLMVSDPLLDSRDVLELPPDGKEQIFHNRVIIRNHTSIFHEAMAEQGFDFNDDTYVPTTTDETEESANSSENLPLSPTELSEFYRFPLIHRRITQQTGKGKIHRVYVLMVVGDGNGMVGLGQGKDEDSPRAEAKAYAQAVRNMDWVERFENRTIWTDMETKLGSTQILLRPRPVGFGLRCNPKLHQVLKAAGIKDISAKVWGSRNPINVIKAAFRVLQAGHAPLAMGDGFGGPGRKLNKGSGLRSKNELERERGRPLISLRK